MRLFSTVCTISQSLVHVDIWYLKWPTHNIQKLVSSFIFCFWEFLLECVTWFVFLWVFIWIFNALETLSAQLTICVDLYFKTFIKQNTAYFTLTTTTTTTTTVWHCAEAVWIKPKCQPFCLCDPLWINCAVCHKQQCNYYCFVVSLKLSKTHKRTMRWD